MILNILLLLLGLTLILVGANCLTDGSSAIAKRFGISELVIGLTIVAFGTSAPELVISLMSAIKGNSGLAIGNVVGSNIFNVLMIIGCVALVRPIKVEKTIMTNEIPLVILASIALLACCNSEFLDSTAGNVVTRVDGILLLLFFVIFMRYTFSIAKDQGEAGLTSADDAVCDMSDDSAPSSAAVVNDTKVNMVKSVAFIVGGLVGLIWGGNLFVDSASAIASALSVSDAVIGLTIVAAGTSLPELATSIVAAVKGRPGLAVGNVIGSCLFNIFLVLGASAAIHQLPLGGITNVDLLVMLGSAVIFWLTGWLIKHRTITRLEGAVMVLCYIAYTVWLVINAGA